MIALAEHLTAMKPGQNRPFVALGLTALPAPTIAALRHDVERKPDAAGQRDAHPAAEVGRDRAGLTVR